MTTVLNLRTGTVLSFDLPPHEAVAEAAKQAKVEPLPQIQWGRSTVFCGDFGALKEPRHDCPGLKVKS